MVYEYTKRNTTWTFYENGAKKTTKSGSTLYPEMTLKSKITQNFMAELEAKDWECNKITVKLPINKTNALKGGK